MTVWTTPHTWANAEIVKASVFNAEIRDDFKVLYDLFAAGKGLWIPATVVYNPLVGGFTTLDDLIGTTASDYAAGKLSNTSGANYYDSYIGGMVPAAFSSLTEARVIYADDAGALRHITVDVQYGAVGEQFNNHTNSGASTPTTVANKIGSIDISGLLASLAAGDILGIKVNETAGASPMAILGAFLGWS